MAEKVKIVAPEISLLITRAEVHSISYSKTYSVDWELDVGIKLCAGHKVVTSMSLSSGADEDNVRHIYCSSEMRRRLNGVLELIKKNANMIKK